MGVHQQDSAPPWLATLGWGLVILLAGALAAAWNTSKIDAEMRADLLTQAQRLADTLEPAYLAPLSGTPADTQLPEYLRLKKQFQSVRQVFPTYRFIYLMARRPDGTVVFQVDSEPPGSDDESPPGQHYAEITREELLAFDSGTALTSGPAEDRWGVWVSALVPVTMPADYPDTVVLGIDVDAREWRSQVLVRGATPFVLATLALLTVLLAGRLLFARRRRRQPKPTAPLHFLETTLALAVGLVLTGLVAWTVKEQEQRSMLSAFELKAGASAQEIRTELRNLRDFGMEGLVRFFQASEVVDEEGFAHYTDLLAREVPAGHWAWAPQVPFSEREDFEQQIRNQGQPDFRIWGATEDRRELDDDPDQAVHYPVTLLTQRLPDLSLHGFDLASLDYLRSTISAAQQTGLVTASPVLDGTYAPPLRGHMLMVQTTNHQSAARGQDGVVVASIAFEELVLSLELDQRLILELVLLHEDGSREQLAESNANATPSGSSLALEQPILMFGEAFLIRAGPSLAFMTDHRYWASASTLLAGLLLSGMLAAVVSLVTRRRETLEQAVQERTIALQEFRAAVAQSNEGIALCDLDLKVRFVNEAWARMHGFLPREVIGQHLRIFHTRDQMEQDILPGLEELKTRGVAARQVDHLHREGHTFPTRMSASLVKNDQGEPFAILGIAQDISEEQVQRERERFDQRFRTLVAEIAAGFISADDDVRFEQRIDQALAALGGLFEVDRAYLFQFSRDQTSASNTHEWCAPGIDPQKQILQSVSVSDKHWWLDQWRQKRPIRIERVNQMPPEAAAEQGLLQAQSIRSLLCLPLFEENGQLLGFIGFDSVHSHRHWPPEQVDMLQAVADILAGALRRREVIEALAESELRFRELAEEARSFRWQVDTDGLYTDVDPMVENILGYRPEELVGKKHFYDLTPEADREEVRREGLQQIRSGRRFSAYENRILTRHGRALWVSTTIIPLHDEEDQLVGVRGSDTDITERKQAELQLEHLAHHDLLTGLPNRVLLADRLQQAMAQAERRGDQLGVACLDLDAFKPINDRFGHDVGDRLLVTVAQRMQQALRDGDTVARLGGDEFALILVDLPNVESCQPLLQRLLGSVAEPIEHDGHSLRVSISLGISFYPQNDPIDADQLLRQADQAMYQAKVAGKNCYQVFDADHDRRLRSSHHQIERIRIGLEQDEFVLYYQPKVDMKEGRVIGLEALIRWQHPEQGLLPPAAFLPLLQQHNLMIRLGDWVIDSVLTRISTWRKSGLGLPISLNIDPLQLIQPDFIDKLSSALERHPLVQPGDLELEVLETSALDDVVSMAEIIEAAARLGVTFSLDDFGTGYSSLAYLKRLPVGTLKIDRSFVRDMLHDPDDLAILQGIISLAQTFRQDVIAEGVETEAHGEMLLQLGCRQGQGYAIARPMPVEEVPDWLARWHPPPSWLSTEVVDTKRLPLLVAMVEYRNWLDRLKAFLSGQEGDSAELGQPAAEFLRWLDDGELVDFDTAGQWQTLHRRLQAIAENLLGLAAAGQADQALVRWGEAESATAEVLAALHDAL